ncbi:MAG: MerR family transcriptional regulator, partial [Thermodesulfobacteriota bacterium]|nr:MerR family transcriptional regulator [Thermodesulfobacteriota bacterium]
MSANDFMTITDFARELNVAESSVKFWFSRFSRYLPDAIDNEKELYKKESLKDLLFIAEKIHSGVMPTEIENQLEQENIQSSKNYSTTDKTEQNSLNFLTPFLEKILLQQERIAAAHEQRAETEERKAYAIEKRAEAESKKAMAMNNIANALQNMKHEVFPGSAAGNLINEAAIAIEDVSE